MLMYINLIIHIFFYLFMTCKIPMIFTCMIFMHHVIHHMDIFFFLLDT